MHEYSIVQSLIDSCQEYASQNDATQITKVVVKIGVMSGVEPQLLETAFDTFKEETICANAQFVMQIQPIVIVCLACKKESTLKKLEYCCPACQSVALNILDGEDMFLMSLEME